MSCEKSKNLINRLIDGLLSDDEQAELREHIASCPQCALYLREAKELDALLSQHLKMVSPPDDFVSGVMAKLAQAEKPAEIVEFSSAPKKQNLLWRMASIAAALALVVGGAMWYNGQTDVPKVPVADNPPSVVEQQPENPAEDPSDNPLQSGETPVIEPENKKPKQPEQKIGQAPIAAAQEEQYGQVELPKVAYGSYNNTAFIVNRLAVSEEVDVLAPEAQADGSVQYYTNYSGEYQLWQYDANSGEEPQLLSAQADLPETSSDTTEYNECFGGNVAFSPDKTLLAGSFGGDNKGFWLSDRSSVDKPEKLYTAGGGKLISWACDSGKVVFTDESENLYVAFPAEKLAVGLFEGEVASISWSDDSKILFFTAKKAADDYYALYSIILP
ncbi:MAG: zf-HC2 domain-containing protein [Clostridia bacterium]|nr:zf-HC2 domain-containing protein [Clostridia bacterium]MDD4797917.1 zf-HC2 domain-containing protein [Clostridia bacterium]